MKNFLVIVSLAVCSTIAAQGGGIIVYEVGNTGIGNASAGASALAMDASSSYTNPAAITELSKNYLSVGGLLLPIALKSSATEAPMGANTYDQSAGGVSPSFGLYWTHRLSDRFSVGMTVNAPAASALDYNEHWMGRYIITESSIAVINFEPVVAFRINDMWSIGAGVNMYYSSLESNLKVPADVTDPSSYSYATDGDVKIEGNEFSVGMSAGIHFRPCESTRIGLTYRMGNTLDYDGEVSISNATQSLSRPVSTEVPIVNGFNLGFAKRLCNWDLLMDAGFSHWTKFNDMPFSVQLEGNYPSLPSTTTLNRDWDNTWRAGLGANFYFDKWILQTGLSYDSSPVNSETQTYDIPAFGVFRYAVGGIVDLSEKVDLGLHYTFADGFEGGTFTQESAFGDMTGRYTRFILQAIAITCSFKYE